MLHCSLSYVIIHAGHIAHGRRNVVGSGTVFSVTLAGEFFTVYVKCCEGATIVDMAVNVIKTENRR